MRGKAGQKGSALLMALVFITLVLALGVGLLILAQGSVQQSAAVKDFDQGYYAAESAVQLAMQELVAALGNSNIAVNEIVKINWSDLENIVINSGADPLMINDYKKSYFGWLKWLGRENPLQGEEYDYGADPPPELYAELIKFHTEKMLEEYIDENFDTLVNNLLIDIINTIDSFYTNLNAAVRPSSEIEALLKDKVNFKDVLKANIEQPQYLLIHREYIYSCSLHENDDPVCLLFDLDSEDKDECLWELKASVIDTYQVYAYLKNTPSNILGFESAFPGRTVMSSLDSRNRTVVGGNEPYVPPPPPPPPPSRDPVVIYPPDHNPDAPPPPGSISMGGAYYGGHGESADRIYRTRRNESGNIIADTWTQTEIDANMAAYNKIIEAFIGTGKSGQVNSERGGLVFDINSYTPDNIFPATTWTTDPFTVVTASGTINHSNNNLSSPTTVGNTSATSIRVNSNNAAAPLNNVAVIGTASTTTNYNDLKYLYVEGNLVIRGTVNFPKLEKVYIAGKLIIEPTATLQGIPRSGSGDYGTDFLIRGNGLSTGTNFTYTSQNLPGYSLLVSQNTTVEDCRFYVQGGDIGFGGNSDGFVSTNSIYVATSGTDKRTLPARDTAGKIHIGTIHNNRLDMRSASNNIGQFYAEGRLRLGMQNSGANPQGVFITASEIPVFWGPGSASTANTISGLLIGNARTNPGSGGPENHVNPNNSEAMTSVNIIPFGDNPTVMDGGIFGAIRDLRQACSNCHETTCVCQFCPVPGCGWLLEVGRCRRMCPTHANNHTLGPGFGLCIDCEPEITEFPELELPALDKRDVKDQEDVPNRFDFYNMRIREITP